MLSRRKFVFYSFFGFFGSVLTNSHTEHPYLFIAEISGKDLSRLKYRNNKEKLQFIDEEMIRKKDILRYEYLSSDDKVSWNYVFKNKKARQKWSDEHKKHNLFFIKSLPSDLIYSQKEMTLKSNKNKTLYDLFFS